MNEFVFAQINQHDTDVSEDYLGTSICNAVFHLDRGHRLLEVAINNYDLVYNNGRWASGGPTLLTAALKRICNLKQSVAAINAKVFTKVIQSITLLISKKVLGDQDSVRHIILNCNSNRTQFSFFESRH